MRFMWYTHSAPEQEETIEFLTDQGFSQAQAERLEATHNPWYEVALEFEYDPETNDLRVLAATVEGIRLTRSEGIRATPS